MGYGDAFENELEDVEDLSAIFTEEVVSDEKFTELQNEYIEAYSEKIRLDNRLKEVSELEKQLAQQLSTLMIAKRLKSVKNDKGIGISSIKQVQYFAKAETKETFFETLEELGEGALVKRDVNWQTLQSTMKTLKAAKDNEEGGEIFAQMAEKYDALLPLVTVSEKNTLRVTGLKAKLK